MLTSAEIGETLSKKMSLKDTVDELISRALENGGKDNVTIALCEIITGETKAVNATVSEKSVSEPVTVPFSDKKEKTEPKKNGNKTIVFAIIAVVLFAAMFLVGFIIGKKLANNKQTTEAQTTTQTTTQTTNQTTTQSKTQSVTTSRRNG